MLLYYLYLVVLSLPGLALWRWMVTSSWPERYARPIVPVVISEPYLSGTDWKGMVL